MSDTAPTPRHGRRANIRAIYDKDGNPLHVNSVAGIVEVYDENGRRICGAVGYKDRAGTFCGDDPTEMHRGTIGRCRRHGGKSAFDKQIEAWGVWVGPHYEAARNDPELASIERALAELRALQMAMNERLLAGDSPPGYKELAASFAVSMQLFDKVSDAWTIHLRRENSISKEHFDAIMEYTMNCVGEVAGPEARAKVLGMVERRATRAKARGEG